MQRENELSIPSTSKLMHPTALLHGSRVGVRPPVSGAELVPYPTPVTAGLGEANELLDPSGPMEQHALVLCEGGCLHHL